VGELAQAARHVRQLALLLLVLLFLPVPESPLRDPVFLPGPAIQTRSSAQGLRWLGSSWLPLLLGLSL